MKRNLLIRASAGSGKTRQLSFRYLELIAQGAPVSTILASTFTNKATGEILNRILLTAALACRDDSLRNELSRNVGHVVSPEEMKNILRRLTQGLNQIRACSLDSFFSRIAQCFPYELGLKPGWQILDDVTDEALRWDAIQRSLKQNEKNTPTLLRQLFKGETKNLLADEIFNQMKNLLSLERSADADAWEKIQKIPRQGYLTESDIASILSTLTNAVNGGNLKVSLKKSLEKITPMIQANDWYGLIQEKIILRALNAPNGEFKFSNSVVKPQEVCDALIQIARHSATAYLDLMKEQTMAVHQLMREFLTIYEENKLRANGLQFDDVTRRVATFIEKLNGNLQSLSWRMNASINHLLLDEFQDTSLDQWHIFLPFGQHCSKGDNRSFFCVGDVKQAIYRWRNGRSEIFDAIEKTFDGIEQESSNMSWRSAPEIIDCVNRFFLDPQKTPNSFQSSFQTSSQTPASPKDATPSDRDGSTVSASSESSEPSASSANSVTSAKSGSSIGNYLETTAYEAWRKWRYEAHTVSPKSQKYSGYWELASMPEKPKESASENSGSAPENEGDPLAPSPEDVQLQWVAQRIAEIYQKFGGVHRIGVLYRTNKQMPKLAQFLRQRGIPVSEEGKMELTNSNSVRLLLSLLNLMDFPDNSLAWFLVGNSVLTQRYPELAWQDLQRLSFEERTLCEQKKSACLSELRRKYQAFGVASFLLEQAKLLTPYATDEEKRRLKQLLTLAASTEQNVATSRISDFVAAVKKCALEDPTGASVVLMTIHRSKGLQFDAVVLPELSFSLTGKEPQFLPGYPDDDVLQSISLVMPWVKKDLRSILFNESSPFSKAMELNERERISETFSLLYVAMTRAIYAMYLFVPPKTEPNTKKNHAVTKASDLLTLVLAETEYPQPQMRLAYGGNPEWYLETEKMQKALELSNASPSCVSESTTESAAENTAENTTESKAKETTKNTTNDVRKESAQTAAKSTRDTTENSSSPQKLTHETLNAETRNAERQNSETRNAETPNVETQNSEMQNAETPLRISDSFQLQPIIFKKNPDSNRNLTRRAPSNIEDRQLVDLGKKLDFSQQNTVNGTILHSWYEKIAWMENSLPSDEELIAVARPYGLTKERLERLLKSFHNSLKAPKIERVLHWASYLPTLREKVVKAGILPEEKIPRTALRREPDNPNEIRWEVYREKELAIRTDSELLLGTLDRLILLRNDFQVFWADCMDYKTTRKVNNPDVLEEKIKSHRPQMTDYRKMLHYHYRIPENQISAHLIFSMLGIVREV